MGTRKIEISDDIFETAQRTAAVDNIDVNTLCLKGSFVATPSI